MSSTNFGSILIFTSCVVGTCDILRSIYYVGEFFCSSISWECSLERLMLKLMLHVVG